MKDSKYNIHLYSSTDRKQKKKNNKTRNVTCKYHTLLEKENPANITTIGYRAIRYVLLTAKVHIFSGYSHFIY